MTGRCNQSPMTALPTPEIEQAAAALRAAGWIVTPPSEVRYGCFCDLFACEPGTEPDDCVIDQDRRQDCVLASRHKCKEACEYWRAWTPETLAAYWKEQASDD